MSCFFVFIYTQPSARVHATSTSVRTSDAFRTFGSVMEMTTAETGRMSRPTASTCRVRSHTTNASPVDAFRCHGNAMETTTVEMETWPMNHWTAVSLSLSLSTSLSLSMSFCLSLSISVCLSLPQCLSLSVSLSLSQSLSVCLSLCLSLCLCVSVCPCLSLSVCMSVCLSFSFVLSLYVSLFGGTVMMMQWFLGLVHMMTQSWRFKLTNNNIWTSSFYSFEEQFRFYTFYLWIIMTWWWPGAVVHFRKYNHNRAYYVSEYGWQSPWSLQSRSFDVTLTPVIELKGYLCWFNRKHHLWEYVLQVQQQPMHSRQMALWLWWWLPWRLGRGQLRAAQLFREWVPVLRRAMHHEHPALWRIPTLQGRRRWIGLCQELLRDGVSVWLKVLHSRHMEVWSHGRLCRWVGWEELLFCR